MINPAHLRRQDLPAGQNVFNFDIGLLDGCSKLNCSINLHEKSFRYYKCRKEVLRRLDLDLQLIRWAFQKLSQAFLGKRRAAFVPEELFKGNRDIMPAFLKQLRQQKVESFIKMQVTKRHSCPEKSLRLLLCLQKIIKDTRYYYFKAVLEAGKGQIRRHMDNASRVIQSNTRSESRWASTEPKERRHKSLNIEYCCIRLPLNRRKDSATTHSLERSKPPTTVSHRALQQKTTKKMYKFDQMGEQWSKSKVSRRTDTQKP